MSPTDGAAAEGAPTALKRAPSYLHYNRSGNVIGWGITLVVLGQTSLIGAAFAAVTHLPYETANGQTHTSGMAITFLIIGLLCSLVGLATLVAGFVNMAGNVDLIAWATRERMRAAAQAAGLH